MRALSPDFFLFQISTEFCAVFAGGAVLDLPERFNKVAAVREAAFQTDVAGLQPGGAQQRGGFFHPELLDVLDGCDAQKLPETAQTVRCIAEGESVSCPVQLLKKRYVLKP